jgi:hypothetical protein
MMSALGQKQKADIAGRGRQVRFVPKAEVSTWRKRNAPFGGAGASRWRSHKLPLMRGMLLCGASARS